MRRSKLQALLALSITIGACAMFAFNTTAFRWLYVHVVRPVVQIRNAEVPLPDGFYLFHGSSVAEQIVGGFYTEDEDLPVDSYLSVRKIEKLAPDFVSRLGLQCGPKCKDFQKVSIAGKECTTFQTPSGFSQPSETFTVLCPLPGETVLIGYHGSQAHYSYFLPLLSALVGRAK